MQNSIKNPGLRGIVFDRKYSTTQYILFCDGNTQNKGLINATVYKGQELYCQEQVELFDYIPFK